MDDVDDEEAALRVCSMPHCGDPAGIGGCSGFTVCCTGSTPHPLCDACFRGYASAQFETLGGAFEQVLSKKSGISNAGELPCYLFLTDECDCTSIPEMTLVEVLCTDPKALEAYENAERRLESTNETDPEEEEDDLEDGRSLDTLLRNVSNALTQGGYVECPSCGNHYQKDEACMHMKCPCGTPYCYCCGRRRDDGPWESCKSDGSGCDSPSAFLQDHSGWDNFALAGESDAMGALHEFHRRRMAYFLRHVKTNHSLKLWKKLQKEHPNILNDKPTDGRSIQWDEIDTALPPLFGGTTEAQLTWRKGDGLTTEEQDEINEERLCYRRAMVFVCLTIIFFAVGWPLFLTRYDNGPGCWIGLCFIFLGGFTLTLGMHYAEKLESDEHH